jgi:hypothetical protein
MPLLDGKSEIKKPQVVSPPVASALSLPSKITGQVASLHKKNIAHS